jgi:hypothetical protein
MHGWDVVSRLPKQPETKMALLMAMSGYGSSRDQINLRNVEVQRGRVRLGISAPDRVHILRAELFAADEAKRRLAQPVAGPAS